MDNSISEYTASMSSDRAQAGLSTRGFMQPGDCNQPVPDTDSLYIALLGGLIVKAPQMLNHHKSLEQWHSEHHLLLTALKTWKKVVGCSCWA